MAEIEKGLPNEPELKVEDVPVETVVEDIKEEPKDVEILRAPSTAIELTIPTNSVVPSPNLP